MWGFIMCIPAAARPCPLLHHSGHQTDTMMISALIVRDPMKSGVLLRLMGYPATLTADHQDNAQEDTLV